MSAAQLDTDPRVDAYLASFIMPVLAEVGVGVHVRVRLGGVGPKRHQHLGRLAVVVARFAIEPLDVAASQAELPGSP